MDADGDRVVFFSVPHYRGFKALVDGVPTEILKVNYGQMAVKVGKGAHEIEFKYYPAGLKAGMTVEVRIYSGCSYAGKLSSNRRYREARRVSAMTVRRACSALPTTCTTMATSWDPRLVSALLLSSICHLLI